MNSPLETAAIDLLTTSRSRESTPGTKRVGNYALTLGVGKGQASAVTRRTARNVALGLGLAGLLALGGCNLGGGDSSSSASPGSELDNPDGSGTFFVDPNRRGGAARVRIAEVLWGRLVDVFALDPMTGEAEATARFTDLVIDEGVVTNTLDYVLETNPATQITRLVIQREADDIASAQSFIDLVRLASEGLPMIDPKNDDGTSIGPFSVLPRNACLVIRVDDLLDDNATAVADLLNNVMVRTSYPPQFPFEARVIFDPNHGDIVSGSFHTTRVLVDMTISEIEAQDLGTLVAPNLLGLPASLETSGDPNVAIRIPTESDFSIGQFSVLTNLRGKELDITDGFFANNTTQDAVRGFRSGNSVDLNNGFLFDIDRPEVVGGFAITVDSAFDDVSGLLGFDFLLDLTFVTVCESAPLAGDVLEIGNGQFLEVTVDAAAPVGGQVMGVRARILTSAPLQIAANLLGGGLRRTPYDPLDMAIDPSCWLSFLPAVAAYPPVDVDPGAQVMVRFSEPMDPATVSSFETLQIFRAGGVTNPAVETVAGQFQPSADLRTFSFQQSLRFGHSGDGRTYDLVMTAGLDGIKDLAGNTLVSPLDPTSFSIDPAADQGEAAALTLRFNSLDEYVEGAAAGGTDFSGTVFPDFDRGVVVPRPMTRASFTVDPANQGTIPSVFFPFPGGTLTPLNPLGSKLQTVWRYMDFGFLLTDETKVDLNVEGLNWNPVSGSISSDIFARFEIALSHSTQAPDLSFMPGLMGAPDTLTQPNSGLFDAPSDFTTNILGGPSEQVVVHNRGLGYVLDPTDLFTATGTGTFMAPYPLNRLGGPLTTFNWRDTSNYNLGGANSSGVPTAFELGFYTAPNGYNGTVDYSYGPGSVPTIGLPLLMEFRCFPSSTSVGLNAVGVSIALGSFNIPLTELRPFFRAFADGGIDQFGNQVMRDPDLQNVPLGGFAFGLPTPSAENIFYTGQLDTVIAFSRLQTMYLDAEFASPDYFPALIEPAVAEQPAGTGLIVEYRGASSFTSTGGREFDAATFDPYGDPTADPSVGGTVNYFAGTPAFSPDVDDFDGAPFLQVQITFVNNLASGQSPELSTIVLPYGEL